MRFIEKPDCKLSVSNGSGVSMQSGAHGKV